MTTLYENQQEDARQTTRHHLLAGESLFRPRYRQLTDAEVDLHDRIKTQAAVMATLFYEVEPIHLGPSGNRERGAGVQLAIRHLEDAVYRAVKALTGEPSTLSDQARRAATTTEMIQPGGAVDPFKVDSLRGAHDGAGDGAGDGDGERRTGITDLPPEQQKQLDEGRPVEPAPDHRPTDEPPPAPPAPADPAPADPASVTQAASPDPGFDQALQETRQMLAPGASAIQAAPTGEAAEVQPGPRAV